MSPRITAFATALCVSALLNSTARAQQVKIDKYQLPNGMTVILHEDHSLPMVCIDTWYAVGSKDEPPRRSGFAHLFEHLMFMGTKRVPGSDFDVIMEGGGGANNASTSQDRTNYYSLGPAALLPTLLWLDADRLEDLGKQMTQDKLDKQREVVRNERRQTSEMQPYGRARLKISELMYPEDHPYHNTVIGSHEELQAATVGDVQEFFARYYVPNNASLVVAGDFNPNLIKPLIAELFGTLPRGAEVPRKKVEPAKLTEVRRANFTDRVQFAKTMMVYHSPALFGPGDAEMDLAAAVLSDGKSSRLYKRLVYDDQIATDVSAHQDSSLLGSTFTIDVTAKPGVSLDKIEQVTDEVVAEFLKSGPTQAELDRYKAGIEYQAVSGLQSLQAKADKLNAYQLSFGEPDGFQRDLERYRKATPESIREWANKVLTPDARLIMRVLPEEKKAASTSPVLQFASYTLPEAADQPGPRDVRPAPADQRAFTPEMPTSFKLSNGIEVRHWKRSELPLVSLGLLLKRGAASEEGAQAGRTFLMTGMLDEGAGTRGALEFADALDQLGANFSARGSQEAIQANLSVLKRNFDPALALYADAILRPKFEEKEWERVRALHLQGLKRAEDRPPSVASRVGLRTFFGDNHPYGRPVEGTSDTVQALKLDAIKESHQQLVRPEGAVFFIAGDLSAEEAKAALEKAFGSWKSPAGTQPASAAAKPNFPQPANQGLKVVVVDKPGSVQTVIRFYMPGPKYQDAGRIQHDLLNTVLGGSFTSRLNQNLREEHGYTYGANSQFAMAPSAGYLVSGSDVQAEHTGAAIKEFLAEFRRLRKGDVSRDEAAKTREANRSACVQSFQGLGGILSKAAQLELNGLPFSTLGDDLKAIESTNEGDLNKLANRAIPLEQAVLVLVGDKQLILEQLKGLDLPAPVEMTVTGDAKSL